MVFVTCSCCAGQLHCRWQYFRSGNRSKNDHVKMISKILYGSYTADYDISNQATKVKMTVHLGFVELCTTVTADGDISNQAKEVKMTVH